MPRVKMIFSQSLAEAAERLVADPGPLTLLVKRGDLSVEHCARARGRHAATARRAAAAR
jgi:hypothetical protein